MPKSAIKIYLDDDVYKWLKEDSRRNGTSVSQYIRTILTRKYWANQVKKED